MQVLQKLAQVDAPGAHENSAGSKATFLVRLQLAQAQQQPAAAAEDAALQQQPPLAATLQVSVCYSSSACYSLDALPVSAAAGADSEDGADVGGAAAEEQSVQAPVPSPQQQEQQHARPPQEDLQKGQLVVVGRQLLMPQRQQR
jgi:hypothetical protein